MGDDEILLWYCKRSKDDGVTRCSVSSKDYRLSVAIELLSVDII